MRVVAMHDKGWFDAKTEYRLWAQLCEAYGVAWSIDTELPVGDVIVFDQAGTELLEDFPHRDAIYLFGRTGQALLNHYSHGVRIPTPHDKSLFGHQAAAIVLEDRRRWLLGQL